MEFTLEQKLTIKVEVKKEKQTTYPYKTVEVIYINDRELGTIERITDRHARNSKEMKSDENFELSLNESMCKTYGIFSYGGTKNLKTKKEFYESLERQLNTKLFKIYKELTPVSPIIWGIASD